MGSADIKAWLVENLAQKGTLTKEKEWKRRSKSKNENGEDVRVFEHPTAGTHTVIENQQGNLRFAGPSHEQTTSKISSPLSHLVLFGIGSDDVDNGLYFEVDGPGFEQDDGQSGAVLEQLFAERVQNGTLSVFMMEYTHILELQENETREDLALYIIQKFRDSGATIQLDDATLQEFLGDSYELLNAPVSKSQISLSQDVPSDETDVKKLLNNIFAKVQQSEPSVPPKAQRSLFELFPPTDEDKAWNDKFSGRIVLFEISDQGDYFVAFCGFEMSDGTLLSNHSNATTHMMRHIFPDWEFQKRMETQVQENAHAFFGKEGELFELQNQVIAKLEQAGVVKASFFESDVEPPTPQPPKKTGWKN